MKLKELASKLGLELRGDGGVEIFAPAPIEAFAPMIASGAIEARGSIPGAGR